MTSALCLRPLVTRSRCKETVSYKINFPSEDFQVATTFQMFKVKIYPKQGPGIVSLMMIFISHETKHISKGGKQE
jgi:hypothetical protein